jgi:alkylhydroperoxidase family enzyme
VRPARGEDLLDVVSRYEASDLPERQKVALRFADAFLAAPAAFGAAERSALLEHYEPAQVVELALKLVAWSVNKSMVALGVDHPIDEERLTPFDYDDEGRLVLDTA